MGARDQSVGAEFLVDLAEILTSKAVEVLNVDTAAATAFGQAAAAEVADSWGGLTVYIPKDKDHRIRAKHAEIYRRFSEANAAQLAREFDVSVQQIYKIVRAERVARQQKQHRLDWD